MALLGMFLVFCDFLAFFVSLYVPRPCIVYFHHPVSFIYCALIYVTARLVYFPPLPLCNVHIRLGTVVVRIL